VRDCWDLKLPARVIRGGKGVAGTILASRAAARNFFYPWTGLVLILVFGLCENWTNQPAEADVTE
jgi:hypothetical protein